MKPGTAFDSYQGVVNADPEHVTEARSRRNVFCDAFKTQPDCLERLASGSLARGTQRDPIHDVDLIMVYDHDAHPDWGSGSITPMEALEHVRAQVNELLSKTNGSYDQRVYYTLLRNHVVKCFLDDPSDPYAFAVEVMPALRIEGGLLVPEKRNQRWVTVNPEYLKRQVAARHKAWSSFAPMVRVIKAWKDYVGLDMKSLVAEVLVLERMPHPPSWGTLTRQEALAGFFTAAADAVMYGVHDPAGLCGEIQPDLDRPTVRAHMLEAADLAARALAAERQGDDDRAVRLWGQVFGPDFPKPPAKASPALLVPAARPRVKEAPQG